MVNGQLAEWSKKKIVARKIVFLPSYILGRPVPNGRKLKFIRR